jgi:hypothetical protein
MISVGADLAGMAVLATLSQGSSAQVAFQGEPMLAPKEGPAAEDDVIILGYE